MGMWHTLPATVGPAPLKNDHLLCPKRQICTAARGSIVSPPQTLPWLSLPFFFFNQPLALIYWNDRPHTTEKNRMPSVSLSLSTQPLSPSAPSPPPGGIRQYLRGGSWEGVVEGVGGQATLHTVYHLNKLQHWRKNLGTWPWAPWLLWFGASE